MSSRIVPIAGRLRFALPFTLVAGDGRLRLIGGEDVRLTLALEGLETWGPAALAPLHEGATADELAAKVAPAHRAPLAALLEELLGERVLVEIDAPFAPLARPNVAWSGDAGLSAALGAAWEPTPAEGPAGGEEVRVFAQRTLDRTRAIEAATRARLDGAAFLWVSTGAVARSFVGPLIVPRDGPCLGCLFEIFQRRSPFADLHDELDAHAARGGSFAEASPGPLVTRVLSAIVAWKLEQARAPLPSAALFRLHVVEHEALEISTHPVARLDDCASCAAYRARGAARTGAP